MWHLKPALLVGSAVFAAFSLLAGKTMASARGALNGGTPVSKKAIVEAATGGMNVRTAPRLDAPLVAQNNAFAGTTVDVLATGIVPEDGSGGEWWKIVTPGGSTGFARAVDPQGVHNFGDAQ